MAENNFALFFLALMLTSKKIKMRRILKYKYYNTRDVRPKCYRVKILQSKKQKWKLFIKRQGWFIKKLLRKTKLRRKNKKKRTYDRRRKKSTSVKFRRKWRRRNRAIKNNLKTSVKTGRWLKIKKANPAFIFRRIFYTNYEKFFSQRYLKKVIENRKNRNKLVSLKSLMIKPLFNYAVLLFRASLLSTVHESISHFRSHQAFENAKKLKHSCHLVLGNFYGTSTKSPEQLGVPLKKLRKKYNKKLLLLLFIEIDYYTKSFVVVKNLSELKNKECSLLIS